MSTQLEINDIMVIVQYLNTALSKGVFTKEELEKFYPTLCKVIDSIVKANRENFLNNYKQGEVIDVEKNTLA